MAISMKRRRAMVRASNDAAAEHILAWFNDIGLVVPEPTDIALRWTENSCIEIPLAEAVEDEDLVITPDMPDLETIAHGVVSMVREADERPPHRLSPRRWPIVGKVASLLYVSGITRSGGSIEMNSHGTFYWLPRWRDVLPGDRLRPYLLWKQDWWWHCQRDQGWRIRGRHKPKRPFALGICAACVPCPSCGAEYHCRPDCEIGA